MDTLIIGLAQLLPLAYPVVALVVWLNLPRTARRSLAVRAVAAITTCALLVLFAGLVHYDPRPFVVSPGVRPLFAHGADNGFPSDHTAYAATIALLVLLVSRRTGTALLVGAVVIGAARVAAHVHHVQDVVASLVIAAVAVGVTQVVAHRPAVSAQPQDEAPTVAS